MGAGAGILVSELHRAGLLNGKRIAVFEPERKATDDKTYCFWAGPNEPVMQGFGELVSNVWEEVAIDGAEAEPIAPLAYCRIRSIDLYAQSFRLLEAARAARFAERVTTPAAPASDAQGPFRLEREQGEAIWAHRVFDSRPPRFEPASPTDVRLSQSFFGWRIRLNRPTSAWNERAIHMMDFQVAQGPEGEFQFMYVLPEGPDHGLVELTRFGAEQLGAEEAKPVLAGYIASRFGPFEQLESEAGNIPMCHAPMAHHRLPQHARWTALGTRAGAVKPSTGYAFKAMVAQACALRDELAGTAATAPPRPGRFAFYDHLLLLILRDEPRQGVPIFQRLFRARDVAFVLGFLDERTTLRQELAMFARLPILPFLRALAKRIRHHAAWKKALPGMLWLFAAAGHLLLARGARAEAADLASWIVYGGGLLLIGLPHGALDAVTTVSFEGWPTRRFYARYLSWMAAVCAAWWVAPNAALLAFLGTSAWHFGQSDVVLWQPKRHARSASLAWGSLLLAFILGQHTEELGQILAPLSIHAPTLSALAAHSGALSTGLWAAWLVLVAALAATRHWPGLLAAAALACTAGMPLLPAFASYFIFHHSVSGWAHLRAGTGWSHQKLWRKGAPFTAGALIFLAIGVHLAAAEPVAFAGTFFAALSAISIPHILAAHRFIRLSHPSA